MKVGDLVKIKDSDITLLVLRLDRDGLSSSPAAIVMDCSGNQLVIGIEDLTLMKKTDK